MPSSPAKQLSSTNRAFLEAVRARAQRAGVFGPVRVVEEGEGRLVCDAEASGAPAEFRTGFEAGPPRRVWISLVTLDRWLSQSIEADLVHTGDKLDDLLEEELIDQGFEGGGGGRLAIQHFRSDDKLYTFRAAAPLALDPAGNVTGGTAAAEMATKVLLAFEACFRELGDMEADDEE